MKKVKRNYKERLKIDMKPQDLLTLMAKTKPLKKEKSKWRKAEGKPVK